MDDDKSNSETTLVFDEIADISRAAAYKQRLEELLEQDGEIVLDAAKTSRFDTAVLQLLAVFFASALGPERRARWVNVPEQLRLAARQLDLYSQIGLDSDAP